LNQIEQDWKAFQPWLDRVAASGWFSRDTAQGGVDFHAVSEWQVQARARQYRPIPVRTGGKGNGEQRPGQTAGTGSRLCFLCSLLFNPRHSPLERRFRRFTS
jgi:hypothetical protein